MVTSPVSAGQYRSVSARVQQNRFDRSPNSFEKSETIYMGSKSRNYKLWRPSSVNQLACKTPIPNRGIKRGYVQPSTLFYWCLINRVAVSDQPAPFAHQIRQPISFGVTFGHARFIQDWPRALYIYIYIYEGPGLLCSCCARSMTRLDRGGSGVGVGGG